MAISKLLYFIAYQGQVDAEVSTHHFSFCISSRDNITDKDSGKISKGIIIFVLTLKDPTIFFVHNGWTIKVITSGNLQDGDFLEEQSKRFESPVFSTLLGNPQDPPIGIS